jgi:uncharacterized membrane protein YedE/YeeE
MHNFTPGTALLGGLLIGVAATLLLWTSGRVAGISGMLGALVSPGGERAVGGWFLLGLVVAGAGGVWLFPAAVAPSPRSLAVLAVGGLVVGAGTRLGRGCTSGHGVCGISRFSTRSIAATVAFMLTGVITVTLVRLLGGAG